MSSSLAFMTHPSVRIKGTENAYTPTQCLDDLCPVKAPHLHCPFCVKSDAYQDPVILKAHYRVKHVDKGIEFAGLKILRCCDQCDIVGIIKGEKRFKGAHWHCYRCRNGFNRRDEAIKHYKTHFRNPQTTFQIQITQDLNSPPMTRNSPDGRTNNTQEGFTSIEAPVQEIVHTALTETLSLTDTSVMAGEPGSNGKIQSIKVKHEPLDKNIGSGGHEDQQTIMIIQGDHLESAFASHIINPGDLDVMTKANHDPNISWEIRFRMEEEEKNMYKAKAQDYKAQVELLQEQVAELESQITQLSEMKLQEFISDLNSGEGDYLQKQTMAVQLAKFLEHIQGAHNSSSSEQNLHQPQQPHSNSSLVELHHVSSDSLPQEMDSSRTISHELNSGSVVTQLSGIPEGYHVVSTTPEGHVLVRRTSTLSSDEDISVTEEDPGAIDNSLAQNTVTVSVSEPLSTTVNQNQTRHGNLIQGSLLSHTMSASPSQPILEVSVQHPSDQPAAVDQVSLTAGEGQTSLTVTEQREALASVVPSEEDRQTDQTAYVMDIVVQNRLLDAVSSEVVGPVIAGEEDQAVQDQNFVSEESDERDTKRIRLEL